MILIPTTTKEKLPKGYAYPLGAEQISAPLQDALCLSLLRLSFSWRDTFWSGAYADKLRQGGAIQVLSVTRPLLSDERLSIRVHAVPQAEAAVARTLLLDQSLPELAAYLASWTDDQEWVSWSVEYDLGTHSLKPINASGSQSRRPHRVRPS
ncbi:hypothetical protein C7S18_14555 [Ahniella affigens]|uniref:Uncharacterized protein n=1 Tax=Ahniella affigens TaxID=2021234 RepID=A0A2P1PU15_9GAMM|nr:hypothetical protein C7S18_14555 [Ahniella affigens]